MELELQALLEVLASSPSPVASAVRWVESHGRTGLGSNHSGIGSLWRFVPDVLTKEVVFLEEPLEPASGGIVGNCLWLQTLPVTLQANILTFLATEHVRFRSTDLKVLAHRVLGSGEVDHWVRRAAQILLTTTSAGIPPSSAELQDLDVVPSGLFHTVAGEGSMVGWLPVKPSSTLGGDGHVDEEEIPQDGGAESNEIAAKRRKLHHQVSNVADPSQEHEEPAGKHAQCSQSRCPVAEPTRSPEKHVGRSEDTNEGLLGPVIFNRAMLLRETFLSNQLAAGRIQEEEVQLFRVAPDLNILLTVLRPWEFDDDGTLALVGSLLGDQEGYAWSAQMMSSLVLPKLQGLEQPASRIMLTAVVQAAKAQPRASVDSIILPLLRSEEGASPAQCEVINRVIKDCLTVSAVSLLLRKMFRPEAGTHWGIAMLQPEGGVTERLAWTEAMVGVLQNLLNFRGLALEEDITDPLVASLQGVADRFAGSLKFANVLLSFVTKHKAHLKPSHVRLLHQVAERTTTFLSKSLIAKLSKL